MSRREVEGDEARGRQQGSGPPGRSRGDAARGQAQSVMSARVHEMKEPVREARERQAGHLPRSGEAKGGRKANQNVAGAVVNTPGAVADRARRWPGSLRFWCTMVALLE